jgi:hypothetical protein
MAEKGKQRPFAQERQREMPERAWPKNTIGEPPPPMADDNFARRAGEIIARAVRTATEPFHRRGRSK